MAVCTATLTVAAAFFLGGAGISRRCRDYRVVDQPEADGENGDMSGPLLTSDSAE